MEVKEGKWRTRGGEVVTAKKHTNNPIHKWVWSVFDEGGLLTGLVDRNGRHDENGNDSPHDLVAPVHEITPGSEWRLKGGDKKWFVVGKTRDARWVVQREDERFVSTCDDSDFLEPWTDPPKPRTWTRYIAVCEVGSNAVTTVATGIKRDAENAHRRISNVVEVTLTEEVNCV